jgi:ribosomal-protein-alanine N-acetyltransferase
MKNKMSLRHLQVGDAKRFVEILNHPDFIHFPAKPESIEAEKEFLRKKIQARREGREFSYSILLNNKVVGGAGLKIDPARPYLAEIGYFVDEAYWGRGIASRVVELIEQVAFEEKGIVRIEILMTKKNKASERVAIKCGYRKEGIAKGKLLLFGKYEDAYIYAKTNY